MTKLTTLTAAATLAVIASLPVTAAAQSTAASAPPAAAAHASAVERIDGEIRKVDPATKKLTIRHGEIKSLDMPGMTMLFQVRDPALLASVKPGDKVKFTAEKVGNALVVTDIQVTP